MPPLTHFIEVRCKNPLIKMVEMPEFFSIDDLIALTKVYMEMIPTDYIPSPEIMTPDLVGMQEEGKWRGINQERRKFRQSLQESIEFLEAYKAQK